MYHLKSIHVFISLLIGIQLNACQVENTTAPQWICKQLSQYKNYITSVGIARKLNLDSKIVKKIAIANARIELAYILESKVSSNIFSKTKSHNNEYEEKFISNTNISTKEKIKHYKILETWESQKYLYVLVGINF